MTHTKCPWKVFYSSNGSMLGVGVERSAIGVTDAYGGLWGSGGEKKANAHLIAAAPELLSIVQRFVALPSGAWHPERHAADEAELMADARAVIANATQ